MHRALTTIALAGLVSVALPATTADAAKKVNYVKQYETITAPANKANAAFGKHQTAKTEKAFATVLATTASKLLRAKWPAADRADVHALAVAVEDLSSDLSVYATDPTSISSKLVQDATAEHADANVVRADLGLAPLKA